MAARWIGVALIGAGCASTVTDLRSDASPADVPPTDAATDASPAADSEPLRCLPPADGPLRTPPTGPDSVTGVAEDLTFGCVLRGDGHIRCRGQGFLNGAFADGARESSGELRAVTLPIDDVRSFGLSLHLGCAVRGDGSLWCWGQNTDGYVHPDLPRRMLTPTRVPGIEGARRVFVAINVRRTCVLLDGGRVVCWNGSFVPPTVVAEGGVTDVAVDLAHTCVRFADASARCTRPQGDGVVEIPIGPGGAETIAAGTTTVCAGDRAGAVTCWGTRYPGSDVTRDPFDDGVRCATDLALGFSHLCASTTEGTVTCWGGASFGQIGSTRTDARPMRVDGIDRVVRVLSGIVSACALRDDGSFWCWGDGYLASDRRTPGGTRPHPIDW